MSIGVVDKHAYHVDVPTSVGHDRQFDRPTSSGKSSHLFAASLRITFPKHRHHSVLQVVYQNLFVLVFQTFSVTGAGLRIE